MRNLLTRDTPVLSATADPESNQGASLWLLDGGLDGKEAIPVVVANFTDGIRVFSDVTIGDTQWPLLLPRSLLSEGTSTGDCPPWGESFDPRPCWGMSTCTQQLTGASAGIKLIRTGSGATFGAWVEYASNGTYALSETLRGGEMPGRAISYLEIDSTHLP